MNGRVLRSQHLPIVIVAVTDHFSILVCGVARSKPGCYHLHPFFLFVCQAQKNRSSYPNINFAEKKGDARCKWTEVYNYDKSRWRSTVKIPSSGVDIGLQNQMCQNRKITNSWLQEMCKEDLPMYVSAVSRQGCKPEMEVEERRTKKLLECNNDHVCPCWSQLHLCIFRELHERSESKV